MTPADLQELLAQAPKRPCNEQDMAKAISIFNQVINNIINNLGSVVARCTLTNNTASCVAAQLDVTNFHPLLAPGASFSGTIPTVADNRGGYALFGSKTGWIAWDGDADTWDVIDFGENTKTIVTEIYDTTNRRFRWHYETISSHSCDAVGVGTWEFTTTTATVVREQRKNDCTIEYRTTDVEVLSKTENTTWLTAYTFTERYDVMYDWYQSGSDGNIYGNFLPITVVCSGTPYARIVAYTDPCASGSG